MAFSWSSFLTKIEVIAVPLTLGIFQLKNEVGSVTNSQLASDSLNMATGVTEALGSSDPAVVAQAQAAQQVGLALIQGIMATHPAITPPASSPTP